jgi:hypothetical protein
LISSQCWRKSSKVRTIRQYVVQYTSDARLKLNLPAIPLCARGSKSSCMGVPPSSGVELVVDVSLHSLSLRRRIFGWQGGSRGDGPHRVERMGPKKRSGGPKGSHAASCTCGSAVAGLKRRLGRKFPSPPLVLSPHATSLSEVGPPRESRRRRGVPRRGNSSDRS